MTKKTRQGLPDLNHLKPKDTAKSIVVLRTAKPVTKERFCFHVWDYFTDPTYEGGYRLCARCGKREEHSYDYPPGYDSGGVL